MSDILDRYRDKNILIWGYGREGKSTEDFFKKHPVVSSVTVSEAKPDEIDLSGYDYVFKSPGIRLDYPTYEGYIGAFDTKDMSSKGSKKTYISNENYKKLTSQTELFIEAFRERVIGITGTKGKSTTTSLLHHVLAKCFQDSDKVYKDAYLVGNIGVPCLDYYDEMAEGDKVAVFELSCHQLAYLKVSPHIALFLNLYEDHLDFYGDRATYFQAKRHITEFQSEGDYLFLGSDVPELVTKANIIKITDLYNDDDMRLVGEHNRYNASFVNHVADTIYGLKGDEIKSAIDSFSGLPHRLQYIGEVDGVRYYDDSISTIPEATIQAADSITDVATVLIGGMDREIDYTPLIRYMLKNNKLNYICMYESGKRIYDELINNYNSDNNSLVFVDDLSAAVDKAKAITPKGRACVLSPAAASYGYFKNFEDRGDRYKELVYENTTAVSYGLERCQITN